MDSNKMVATSVSLGKNGDKTYSRPGFVNSETREVALPPKNSKGHSEWMNKHKIPESARNVFSQLR